jgi:hypothetical protein
MALVRLLVTICIAMAGLRAFAEPLHLIPPEWPGGIWINSWVGPGRFGGGRARVEARLEQLPGSQLAIVRYSPVHEPMDEWVYNAADIDSSKVIWAREMDAANNLDLIRYYKDRQVWLVQPDAQPAKVSPYAMPEQAGNAAK